MLEHGAVVDATGAVMFARAIRPQGFVARLRGLLGRPTLTDDQAWWFSRCSAVHTIGMRAAIDVLHLDAEGRVVKICASVPPLRSSASARASQVLELNSGAAQRAGITLGQQLRFVP